MLNRFLNLPVIAKGNISLISYHGYIILNNIYHEK